MLAEKVFQHISWDDSILLKSLGQVFALALGVGLVFAFALFMEILGPRPDIAAAVHSPRFLFKFAVTLTLAASAVALLMRLARPGAASWTLSVALWTGPLLLALGVLYELTAVPASFWAARLIGTNSKVCLASIPVIAAPVLVAALIALRRGAPTRPAIAGAVAGLAAGGLGATLYAAHCIDDSPLFVMAWYLPAIALVAGVGALAGVRVLRW